MDTTDVLSFLSKGEITVTGQFLHGSNYTFLAQVMLDGHQRMAVYKPIRGEQPLWDFPHGSLAKREVAAWAVSESLGWGLVPPTIYRRQAPLGAGSLQLFIEHDTEYHYFNFGDVDKQRLRPVVVFDMLINNADRKGSHVFFDAEKHLWCIDHGVCFNIEDKVRTVIWDFAGEPIPAELMVDIQRFLNELDGRQGVYEQINRLLEKPEIKALASRARFLLEEGAFPLPSSNRRSFPWPPV